MKNIILISSVLILWGAMTGCKNKVENPAQSVLFEEPVTPVVLVPVEQVVKSESIVASGLVASTDEARLSFKIGGVIQRIWVKEGQKVSKGQLLATLDLTEINAQVAQAQYGVEKSERDFRRVQNMYKDTAATLEQMQNATTGYDVAKQNLQIAKFNQAFAKIVSPINGVVVRKLANEGELIGPGNPVLFLNSSSSTDWVVRIGVSDKDWARLKLGDKASVSLDAYPDENFSGTITELAPIADPMNKLYEVEVKITPHSKRLASGMFAKIELRPAQTRNYTVIPIEAIIEGNGKDAYVFILDSTHKKAKKIPVKIGYIQDDKVLITSGLEGIPQVITSGSAFLAEGSLLKINEAK
ncbi:MAG: efflux RND transporter periplasmic adaptor subunit [Runella sp.]